MGFRHRSIELGKYVPKLNIEPTDKKLIKVFNIFAIKTRTGTNDLLLSVARVKAPFG